MFMSIMIVECQKICKLFECTSPDLRRGDSLGHCIYENETASTRYTAFIYTDGCRGNILHII